MLFIKIFIRISNVLILDLVLKIRQPMKDEISLIRPGSTFISFVYPGQNQDLVKQLADKKINLFGTLYYFNSFPERILNIALFLSHGLHSSHLESASF